MRMSGRIYQPLRDAGEVVEHKDEIHYYPDCLVMTDVAYYYIDELQALG